MLGKPASDFSVASTGGSFRLSNQRGKRLGLHFSPKDNTPGCTAEGADCVAFGVIKNNTLYGRKVRGIERSAFVIDEEGRLAREWRGVKVPGHVEEVLNLVKAL